MLSKHNYNYNKLLNDFSEQLKIKTKKEFASNQIFKIFQDHKKIVGDVPIKSLFDTMINHQVPLENVIYMLGKFADKEEIQKQYRDYFECKINHIESQKIENKKILNDYIQKLQNEIYTGENISTVSSFKNFYRMIIKDANIIYEKSLTKPLEIDLINFNHKISTLYTMTLNALISRDEFSKKCYIKHILATANETKSHEHFFESLKRSSEDLEPIAKKLQSLTELKISETCPTKSSLVNFVITLLNNKNIEINIENVENEIVEYYKKLDIHCEITKESLNTIIIPSIELYLD